MHRNSSGQITAPLQIACKERWAEKDGRAHQPKAVYIQPRLVPFKQAVLGAHLLHKRETMNTD